ncbi:uncharacterized protein C594.04c [Punica granatum]|uniref:Uncharacterized protein C594.04c n=1 Tax=Punica granatum TaxID=22663 RepID=A0A6P8CIN2_PUNGR|nr:uncharacterized protein C594.04c [Punica granatum]XP_031383036.1 uncharacterized protein C594.04c [Punica granatum]
MGSNLKNFVVALLVPLPSIVFYLSFLKHFEHIANAGGGADESFISSIWAWCFHHPLLLANVLFFFNVNVLFWVIGHLQNSHWMIDLYWTVIPVMLVHYYATHPLAQYNLWRSKIVILLTWVWAMRLNHNYLRREKWHWGAREDWRFTDMRAQYGRHWWWISFFAVYVAQQVFLIGVCLPLHVVHSVDKPLNVWDFVAILVAISGITVAYFADTQLHDFVTRNEKMKELGKPVVLILDEALWRYSRHPNYFGELLWWWGLVIFAWNLGQGWTFVGSLINTMCLAYVTGLVEQRMLKQSHRAEAYRLYQKTTSVWVPWFKASDGLGKEKTT